MPAHQPRTPPGKAKAGQHRQGCRCAKAPEGQEYEQPLTAKTTPHGSPGGRPLPRRRLPISATKNPATPRIGQHRRGCRKGPQPTEANRAPARFAASSLHRRAPAPALRRRCARSIARAKTGFDKVFTDAADSLPASVHLPAARLHPAFPGQIPPLSPPGRPAWVARP